MREVADPAPVTGRLASGGRYYWVTVIVIFFEITGGSCGM